MCGLTHVMCMFYIQVISLIIIGIVFVIIQVKVGTRQNRTGCVLSNVHTNTSVSVATHHANNITTPWTVGSNLRIIIPPSMILIGSSLLWCPNAKSGTSTAYKLLWENEIIPKDYRCYYPKCPFVASKKVKNWSSSKPLSFVIVRNPYDRIRSTYIDKIQPKNRLRKQKLMKIDNNNTTSFYEFVKYVTKHPEGDIHWQPVSSRCYTGNGKSSSGVFQYDYVLKLEEGNLPQKLAEIFARAGIDLPEGIETEPVNRNRYNSSLVDFYRDAAEEGGVTMEMLIGLVKYIYRDDIRSFGYSFPVY